MKKKVLITLFALAAIGAALYITQGKYAESQDMQTFTEKQIEFIPKIFGKLVQVTTHGYEVDINTGRVTPAFSMAWFEAKDGTIRLVEVDCDGKSLDVHNRVFVIKRK